jgi:hypothetical protein
MYSIVLRMPTQSTRHSTHTAGADTAQRENGVAVPPGASARRIIHSTGNSGPFIILGAGKLCRTTYYRLQREAMY